jgi:ABC-2 type transport system ATP-binding protein
VTPAIDVRGLGRMFGPFKAVDDVTFQVEPGEIFGYLGANGAGKSTTIRMLCGLLAPTEGVATVAGHDVASRPESVKSSIGYMSQKFSLYLDLPVEANVEFFGGAYGIPFRALKARAEEVLGQLDLWHLREARTGDLPGGTRQRLALGCALLHRPKILFLDEPTAGVDPVSRRDFWTLIRELAAGGTTIFVTTHYMDEAEYCARIGLMVDGRLVALDTPAGLKRSHVPGLMLAVDGRKLGSGLAALRGRPGVLAAEPFGAGAHVRLDPQRWSADAALAVLRDAGGLDLSAEPVEPSLEDVFLAVVGASGAEKRVVESVS